MKKLELKKKINVRLLKDDIKASFLNFFEGSKSKIKEVKEKVKTGYKSRSKHHNRDIIADPSILPGKIFIDDQPRSKDTDLDDQKNNLKTEVSYEKTPTEEELACNNCGVIISYNIQNFCDLCGQEI